MKGFSFLRAQIGKRSLGDFIRLVLSFYGCLLLLALYQQVRLYEQGVLDSFLNQNLLLLGLHHLGFTASLALLLAFLFRYLENRRPGWGFRTAIVVFMACLLWELTLTEYFLLRYELPGAGGFAGISRAFSGAYLALSALLALVLFGTSFRLFYRISRPVNRILGGMYPFTIVLFSLFLSTLLSEKKPVNLNKSQYLVEAYYQLWTDSDPYDGSDPYPFYKAWAPKDQLEAYLDWPEQPPHIVVIAIEGLSSDFVGPDAPYRNFAPFLDSLSRQSLSWKHFLSNVKDGKAAMPLITGSVPYGLSGFTARPESPARLTLFSLLKKNGYRTSFQYGGNASLPGWDRLLFEERVDEVVDQKSFGSSYQRQDADRAGVSLGFPDQALFDRYLQTRTPAATPRLDVFQTLSASKPYLIPRAETYRDRAEQLYSEGNFTSRESRVVRKNIDLMAAMLYTDQQLERFFRAIARRSGYDRTIFILTGTHHPTELTAEGVLESYRVPLILYSPMLQKKEAFSAVASHLDITPSLLGSLSKHYPLALPEKAAWLGSDWLDPGVVAGKEIPLYNSSGPLRDMLVGPALISGRNAYGIGDSMDLTDTPGISEDALKSRLKRFRAVNRYVMEQNALIPENIAPYGKLITPPGKKELVWIHSVFNGNDFDNAYAMARQLALEGNYERAALLCRYILMEVPGHVDTEILLGRIHAWQGDFGKASDILEQVVQKYPVYPDGYSALLDVYYWSGQDEKSQYLRPAIEEHLGSNREIKDKLTRSAGRLVSDSDLQVQGPVLEFASQQVSQNYLE